MGDRKKVPRFSNILCLKLLFLEPDSWIEAEILLFSEIQLLISKLSEKDKLISKLNSRIEHQEQRLQELEVKDRSLNLVVHGLWKKKVAKPLSKIFRIYSEVLWRLKTIFTTLNYSESSKVSVFLFVGMPRNLVHCLLSSLAARSRTFLL